MVPALLESRKREVGTGPRKGSSEEGAVGGCGVEAPGCGRRESSMRARSMCLPRGVCDVRACRPLVLMV